MQDANTTISLFLQRIDFAHPTWDLFIILLFLIGAFVYGFSLGRDRIIVILVSIYISLAIVNSAPFLGETGIQGLFDDLVAFKLTSFLVVFLLLFFVFAKSGLLRTIATADDRGRWWHIIVFSFLHVGLMISIAMSFLPLEFLDNFSPVTQQAFVSEWGKFIWIVAPIVTMALIRRRIVDDNKK